MSIAGNQFRCFLRLRAALAPWVEKDPSLPLRLESALRSERSAGSRDRRLYRELLYAWLRHLPWFSGLGEDEEAALLAGLLPETPATRVFKASFREGAPSRPLLPLEALPGWAREEIPGLEDPDLAACLLRRASLWLRVQGLEPSLVLQECGSLGLRAEASKVLPGALRIFDEVDVTKLEAFALGGLEVQDLGSQCLLAAYDLPKGGLWLDACAGAGGKALQLAFLLGPNGRIVVEDPRAAALDELALRARRAGLACAPRGQWSASRARVEAAALYFHSPTGGGYDGVLVDAPCTGSGTWRRAPHLKWCTRRENLVQAVQRQKQILSRAAARVLPGGLLLYATCSLFKAENEAVVEDFLKVQRAFTPVLPTRSFGCPVGAYGLRLLPQVNDTDGFFVACLRRGPG